MIHNIFEVEDLNSNSKSARQLEDVTSTSAFLSFLRHRNQATDQVSEDICGIFFEINDLKFEIEKVFLVFAPDRTYHSRISEPFCHHLEFVAFLLESS